MEVPIKEEKDWRSLYRTALMEKDRALIPHNVSKAERAVVSRASELLNNSGMDDEKEALEDALSILNALKTSLEHRDAA